MRVLHAIHDFLPRHRAGSEIYAFELAREQSARHDVFVLAAEYDPAAAPRHSALAYGWRPDRHRGRQQLGIQHLRGDIQFSPHQRAARTRTRRRAPRRAARPQPAQPVVRSSAARQGTRCGCRRNGARLHPGLSVGRARGSTLQKQHVCVEIDAERCSRCFAQSPFHSQLAAGRLTRSRAGRAIGRLGLTVRRLAPAAATSAVRTIAGAGTVSPADIRRRLASARNVFETVDLFVAPSASIGAELVRLGADRRRVEISDYGFRIGVSRPRARRELDSPVRIGFVGTLVWHKGVHVLIEAARSLRGSFEIHLYGDATVFPEYVAGLRRAAAGLPVTFHGGFDRAAVARGLRRARCPRRALAVAGELAAGDS